MQRGPRLALFAAFAVLVALRLPQVWHGRFFGEEGTYFFAHAWHSGAWESLWRPLGGYLNIVASGSTTLARLLVTGGVIPLELAPFVTTGTAFLFQLMPAAVLLTSHDDWLQRRWVRPVALFMIATSPFTEEVWLNSLHSQFHLALASAIILACAVPTGRWARAWRLGLLFIAPLSGPGAIVLAPFFVARAVFERGRQRVVQTGALLAGSAIQIGVFLTPSGVRGAGLAPDELAAAMLVRHVLQPFASPGVALLAGIKARAALVEPGTSWLLIAIAVAVFALLGWIALKRWKEPFTWLVLPGLAIAVVSYWGGISTAYELLRPGFGMRYTFVPQVLLCLGLLYLASSATGRTSSVARVLCGLNLLVGVVFFQVAAEGIRGGTDWRGQVTEWRKDPTQPLQIWPQDWFVDLSPGNRSCRPSPGEPTDPPWCDSAWEAMERESIRKMDR